MLYRGLGTSHETTIGQSLMRDECITLPIPWQECKQSSFSIHHHGIILETVTMIVHVATIEEERAILRLCHEPVPL